MKPITTTASALIRKNAESIVRTNTVAGAIHKNLDGKVVPEEFMYALDYAMKACEGIMIGCITLLEDIAGMTEEEVDEISETLNREEEFRRYMERQLTV